jgi:hypothetical protein
MQAEEAKIGAKFSLLILPDDSELDWFKSENFSQEWRDMADFTCKGLLHCIDLAPTLLKVPENHESPKWNGRTYRIGSRGPLTTA